MNDIPTKIISGYQAAATWGVSVAGSLMALFAVASLLAFLLRKYSS